MRRSPSDTCVLSLLVLLWAGFALGQTAELEPTVVDSSMVTGLSPSLNSLEDRMAESSWLDNISDQIFVASASSSAGGDTLVREEQRYLEYADRVIRSINIVRLPVFGAGTSEDPLYLRFGNAVHITTMQTRIKSYLLMKPGEKLDPYLLADTERILRQTPFLRDATFEVLPVGADADSVDLVLVTRDVWSIGGKVVWRKPGSYRLGVYDRNLLGIGHSIEGEIDHVDDRDQPDHFRGVYHIDNIQGSYISGDLSYTETNATVVGNLIFSRPFRSTAVTTGWAYSISQIKELDPETRATYRAYQVEDIWLGRSLLLGKPSPDGPGRLRFAITGRALRWAHFERPILTPDSNRELRNRSLVLGSISLDRSEFHKGRLIFGFGQTEDVNVGFIAKLTGGYERGELFNRPFGGVTLAMARYRKGLGYYLAGVEVAGFLRNEVFEDGIVHVKIGGFSRLLHLGQFRFRQLGLLDYLGGINRQPHERLRLELPQLDTNIGDTQRVRLALESVLFTPWDPLGFNLAFFLSSDTRSLGSEVDGLMQSHYFSALTTGIRFHNPNFIFDAYELSVTEIPNLPEGASHKVFAFQAVKHLRIGDTNPRPPYLPAFE